jgi:phosphonate transport system substrate-binding protein
MTGVSLSFLIVRSVEHAETPAALDTFRDQLERQLAESVDLRIVRSYAAMREALSDGAAEIGWMPPLLLADANERQPILPLVSSVRDGSAEYCSVLFTPAESKIKRVQDLKGTTVAWVDRSSAAGYLLPRLHLAAMGLDPKELFARELFCGSHGDVVSEVFSGMAAVGATFAGPPGSDEAWRAGFAHVDPTRPVRVLLRTEPVPADLVVCHAKLAVDRARRIGAALERMGTFATGRLVTRRLFGCDGFQPVDEAALVRVRALVANARARGWSPA